MSTYNPSSISFMIQRKSYTNTSSIRMLFTKSNSVISSHEENSSWCLASINELKRKVKIVHIGRGKFKVINNEEGNNFGNIIIDASDISSL
jgi:hypothetical protein